MQSDPGKEWERLRRLYDEKGDGELLELAASFGDLTETAQQVLRDEMLRRGLRQPETGIEKQVEDPRRAFGRWGRAFAEQDRDDGGDPEDGPDGDEVGDENGTEYT